MLLDERGSLWIPFIVVQQELWCSIKNVCMCKWDGERRRRKKGGVKRGGGRRQAKSLEGEITLTMKCTDACDPKTTLIAQVPKTIAQSTCIQNIHDASGRIMQNRKEGEEGNLGGGAILIDACLDSGDSCRVHSMTNCQAHNRRVKHTRSNYHTLSEFPLHSILQVPEIIAMSEKQRVGKGKSKELRLMEYGPRRLLF